MKVLVTGANGFVGRHLCRMLEATGIQVVRAVRNPQSGAIAVGDIGSTTDWSVVLQGVDVIVHLAARAHQMNDTVIDPLAEYRKVNVEGTRNLALQAAKAGVKRFIFMSSIKVNGESTRSGHPFTVDAPPAPDDPYGISKWEAEQALQHVVEQTGLQAVIIRPPLVYGPGVGANFRRLMDLSGSGLPLPLGSIKNLRSLVYVGNLCDLISKCLVHPAAIGQTFLVSDDRDISVPDLLLLLSVALHKKVRLVPMPVGILKLAGYLTGRTAEVERLCCSLQVDISKTKELLGWTPPFTIEQGILETVKTRMMTDDFTPAKERKHSNGS